jgi:hypothetical protein
VSAFNPVPVPCWLCQDQPFRKSNYYFYFAYNDTSRDIVANYILNQVLVSLAPVGIDVITITRFKLLGNALPTSRNGNDTHQLDVGLFRRILIQGGASMGLTPV